MAFVVLATWVARDGEADTVADIIRQMTPLSRQEPACLAYCAQRSLDDPHVFLLYEQYRDRDGYEAHMATAHFARYVRGEAAALLERRERAFYETLAEDHEQAI